MESIVDNHASGVLVSRERKDMHSGISNIHVNGLQKTIWRFDNIFLNQNPWQDPSHEGVHKLGNDNLCNPSSKLQ